MDWKLLRIAGENFSNYPFPGSHPRSPLLLARNPEVSLAQILVEANVEREILRVWLRSGLNGIETAPFDYQLWLVKAKKATSRKETKKASASLRKNVSIKNFWKLLFFGCLRAVNSNFVLESFIWSLAQDASLPPALCVLPPRRYFTSKHTENRIKSRSVLLEQKQANKGEANGLESESQIKYTTDWNSIQNYLPSFSEDFLRIQHGGRSKVLLNIVFGVNLLPSEMFLRCFSIAVGK